MKKMMALLFLLTLSTQGAFAAGDPQEQVGGQELQLANMLTQHQDEISAELEKAGIHGSYKILDGTTFGGSTPSYENSGFSLNLAQCRMEPVESCMPIGTLRISVSRSQAPGLSVTPNFQVAFEPAPLAPPCCKRN